MEQVWDNLLVLDACRFDTFKRLNPIAGDLKPVRSKATCTPQWLKRNFTGVYDDVVYVAGNPYVSKLANNGYFDADEHFFHVEHVWDDNWNNEHNTVLPETVTEHAIKAQEEFPDKRLIVHYMQPHQPFIGETTFENNNDLDWRGLSSMWGTPELHQAYEENLDIVLESVQNLIEVLSGDTVITSDHGELLESKYGFLRHPKDVFLKELYTVPWLEVSGD